MDYIKINGKKIELTKEQVEEIKISFGLGSIKLSEIKAGDTFKIGKYEFITLEQSGDTTAVILKDLLHDSKEFGKNNNYENSYVDDTCNEFELTIADIIGAENLIEHTVDLISDDGLKDYVSIKRKMSLITCNQYRRYVEIFDKFKVDKWWWLATAYSTPTHDDNTWAKCVSPLGYIRNNRCNCNCGVRPYWWKVRQSRQ